MPASTTYILLTGATGYIGKHILWQLLSQDFRVVVPVRSKKQRLRKRVLDLLKPFGPFPEDHLQVIKGDLSKADCGIDSGSLEKLSQKNIMALIHCAGMTRFDSHLAGAIEESNLQGTKNIYALCVRLGIESFHHLSTAYVAGDTNRTFKYSDLDLGQDFNNPYERSKFETEKFLHQAGKKDTTRIVVYRPSIVVGGYPIGENNVVNTVYTFLKVLHFIRECCWRDMQRGRGVFAVHGVKLESDTMHIPLRIEAIADTRINLVSVNTVVNRIIEKIKTNRDKYTVVPLLGEDFFLTELHKVFCRVLAIKGIAFVAGGTFEQEKRNIIEERFFRSTRSYQPYLLAAPKFEETEKSPDPNLDLEKIAAEFCDYLKEKSRSKQHGLLNSLALDALGIDGTHDYFYHFVNEQLGEGFSKRISYVDTKIRFLIKGKQDFDRTIHFNKGKILFVEKVAPDCCYELNQPLFNDIVNGRTDLKNAFFEGKVKIEGNKELALKFGFLFSDYFQHIDEWIINGMAGQ